MTYEQFRKLVGEMREAQKSYFKTRSVSVLQDSKRLEKEVDTALKFTAQSNLFGKESAQ